MPTWSQKGITEFGRWLTQLKNGATSFDPSSSVGWGLCPFWLYVWWLQPQLWWTWSYRTSEVHREGYAPPDAVCSWCWLCGGWLHGDIQLCRVCHHGGSPAGAPGSCPGQARSQWAAPSHPNLQHRGPLEDSSPGQYPAAVAWGTPSENCTLESVPNFWPTSPQKKLLKVGATCCTAAVMHDLPSNRRAPRSTARVLP